MENKFKHSRTGRVWAGLFLVGIGLLLLADRIGFGLPAWVFSWPMILIAVGAFLGLRHGFRGAAWLILIVVGSVFLFDIISPDYSLRRYFWPIIVMVIGLIMILKPKSTGRWRAYHSHRWGRDHYMGGSAETVYKPVEESQVIPADETKTTKGASGDYLDSAAIFAGIKKSFFTKDFKGGEAVSLFGGHEINLSKSDITGTVTLELTQIFGGTKLIVPNNWTIRSEVVAFMGGIDDKRHTDMSLVDPNKILVLKGTSILGGIDIKSY